MNTEELRKDFPTLSRKINGKGIVYLDSACMSLKPVQVINAVMEYYTDFPGCGGRSIHKISVEVSQRVEEARKKIASFINAKPGEIVYTKNASEGINLVANAMRFSKGDAVLITDKEHNSNLVPWQILAKRKKINLRILPTNPDGTFDMDGFAEVLENEKIKLVSIVHTSNLDGVTNPVKEISRLTHKHGALLLLDGAQSVGHCHVDVQEIKADFMVMSMHKMLAPTGVGALYIHAPMFEEMDCFITGGETVSNTTYTSAEFLDPPQRYEAGLQNYAGIIGSTAAVDYLERAGVEKIEQHCIELNRIVQDELGKIEKIKIIGPAEPKLRGSVFSFNIEGWNCHDVGIFLDEMDNVMVRTGRLYVHSWFNARKIDGCVRASFYLYNNEQDVHRFTKCMKKCCKL